jgi:hypothetical protein
MADGIYPSTAYREPFASDPTGARRTSPQGGIHTATGRPDPYWEMDSDAVMSQPGFWYRPPPPGTPISPDSLARAAFGGSQQYGRYKLPENQRKTRELMAMAVPSMGTAKFGREAVAGGVGILGATAQLVPAMLKTSAEKENERRLAALRRLEDRGGLGLSESDVAMYQRQLMEPVRGMAREQRMATEARQASDPAAARSAASLARGQREEHRSLREAGQVAGAKVVAADLQRVAEQRTEIQERIAGKGREERRRMNVTSQYIGALAKPVAQIAASAPVKVISKEDMADMVEKHGAYNAMLMANMMRDMGPGQRRQFLTRAIGGVEEV